MTHQHKWEYNNENGIVIDTYPEQYRYECKCGAVTHDPAAGELCVICSTADAWDSDKLRQAMATVTETQPLQEFLDEQEVKDNGNDA